MDPYSLKRAPYSLRDAAKAYWAAVESQTIKKDNPWYVLDEFIPEMEDLAAREKYAAASPAAAETQPATNETQPAAAETKAAEIPAENPPKSEEKQ